VRDYLTAIWVTTLRILWAIIDFIVSTIVNLVCTVRREPFVAGACVATAIYAGFAAKQWSVANDQLSVMLDAQRPWVSININPESGIDKDNVGYYMIFKTTLQNVGQRPAFTAEAQPVITNGWPIFLQKCRPSVGTFSIGYGVTVFPNQDRISRKRLPVPSEPGKTQHLGIGGCVGYKLPEGYGREWHFTNFAYYITTKQKLDNNNPLGSKAPALDEITNADDIVLVPLDDSNAFSAN
jgi:hypothetical protein